MNKVAVFGKPGSGKSTFSKKLAASTDLPLHQLDSIVFKPNGEHVAREIYDRDHEAILSSDQWIIDGFGPIDSFFHRLERADTLIYIDLPYSVSYWLVTKRCLKGVFVKPEGWPDGSSVLKGTMESYKTLKLCPKFWNENFLQRLVKLSADKTVHIVRSLADLDCFVAKYVNQ